MNKKLIILPVLLILIIGASIFYAISHNNGDNPKSIETINNRTDYESAIYDYQAESIDDCLPGEKFDSINSSCYFECTEDIDCEQYEEEVDGYLEELDQFADSFEYSGSEEASSIDATSLYQVVDEKITLIQGENSAINEEIWSRVAFLTPDNLSSEKIDYYGVFDNADEDTIAYVVDDENDGKYKIVFNIAAYTSSPKSENDLTIFHELAHIITTGKGAVSELAECRQNPLNYINTYDECYDNQSIMGVYTNTFWENNDLELVKSGQLASDSTNKEKFVSEYASTSPEEDIAETFAHFVATETIKSDTLVDKKMKFMNNQKNLFLVKNSIRTNILRETVKQSGKIGN